MVDLLEKNHRKNAKTKSACFVKKIVPGEPETLTELR